MIHDHKLIKSREVHQLVLPDTSVISGQRAMKNYLVSQATSNIVYLLPLSSSTYLIAKLFHDASNLKGCRVEPRKLNEVIELLEKCNSFSEVLDKGKDLIRVNELQGLNIDGWWQDVLGRYRKYKQEAFYYIDYDKGKVKVLSELEL